MDYDVIIVGAGVVGCCIARELSRYRLKLLVLEKESDVARGASGRNSGVVHSGIQVPPGSLKFKFNVAGSKLFPKLCQQLEVPYRRVGKLMVAQTESDIGKLKQMRQAASAAGLVDLKLLDAKGLKQIEPYIEGLAALYSPSEAIISPHALNIALAENALKNGADIRLNTQVTNIKRSSYYFNIQTSASSYTTRYVVNSAGVWADKLAQMVGINRYHIYPWRGEYWVMDKKRAGLIKSMIYPTPKDKAGGLGIHLTPTIDGNILLGPSAEYIEEREDYRTTRPVLDEIFKEAKKLLPAIEHSDIIASYAGIRSKLNTYGKFFDFIVHEDPIIKGFINLVGIESPGLSAAPAIARQVVAIIGQGMELASNMNFNPVRHQPPKLSDLLQKQKMELIKNDSQYGEIICRCEKISRKEVLAAIQNPLKANSISAIKYRCRAGMGRCQGGYCLPKIVDMLEENGMDDITLDGPESKLFIGPTKELLR